MAGATFSEQVSVRLESGDARRLDALADRMALPSGSVARLLVRLGLDAVARDPSVLLGAEPPAAPVAGLPPGTRTRASA